MRIVDAGDLEGDKPLPGLERRDRDAAIGEGAQFPAPLQEAPHRVDRKAVVGTGRRNLVDHDRLRNHGQ